MCRSISNEQNLKKHFKRLKTVKIIDIRTKQAIFFTNRSG